jgi:hypothetical protein
VIALGPGATRGWLSLTAFPQRLALRDHSSASPSLSCSRSRIPRLYIASVPGWYQQNPEAGSQDRQDRPVAGKTGKTGKKGRVPVPRVRVLDPGRCRCISSARRSGTRGCARRPRHSLAGKKLFADLLIS